METIERSGHARPKTPLPAQTRTLLLVVLINSLSYSIILPFLPSMIVQLGGGAAIGGLLIALPAICTMLCAPWMGKLADRIGARPILLFTLIGTFVSYAMMAATQSMVMLFVARALGGAMAGNLSVVQAAMARASSQEDRARAMGLNTAMWALGFVLGPALGVLVSKASSHPALAPSLVAMGGTLISFISVLIWGQYSASAPTAANSVGSPQGVSRSLLVQTGCLAVVQTGLVAITGFFVRDLLGWDVRTLSLLMLEISVAIVAVQILAIPRLVRKLGEAGALVLALVLGAIGCLAIALSPRVLCIAVAAPLVFASITIGQTAIITLLSKSAEPGRQGAVMGLANGVQAGGRVVGPIAFGFLYAAVTPIAPYVATAGLMIAGGLALSVVARRARAVVEARGQS